MPSLGDFQQTFHDCLRARDMTALERYVNETKQIPATERLAVYRGNVYVLLKEVLQDTFSRVHTLVGEDCFQAIAYRFISEHPPKSGRMLDYGLEFASFIEGISELKSYPYLSDVARLEWMLNEAYYAEDAPKATLVNVQDFEAEQLLSLGVKFPPAVYFLQSKFPLQHIWELASHEREDVVNMDAGGDQVMLIRPEWETQVYWLDPAAYAFLYALHGGSTLEQAYVRASALDAEFDLASMLVTCLRHNYFVKLERRGEK